RPPHTAEATAPRRSGLPRGPTFGGTTLKRLILIAFALGLTATMLVACGGSSSGLTGKTWHLTAITEKVPAFQGVIPAADQSKYAITFNADGTFSATADCNQCPARTRRRAP